MTIWTENSIKKLLDENEKAVIRALHSIWEYQTDSEQIIGDAIEQNGIGFNKPDSFTAKKLIQKLEKGIKLTEWEHLHLKRMMIKYVGQLTRIANLNEMIKVAAPKEENN